MDVVSIHSRELACGTLLWIGDPSIPEFQDVYQHCVRNVAQVALRESVRDAVHRPAANVHRIVVARTSRCPSDRDAFDSLSQRYPKARWVDLLGSLCEGIRQSSIADSMRVAWHRWDQVLPQWLADAAFQESSCQHVDPQDRPAGSVAVVASSFATAEAYLDLAATQGVTAVWCAAPNALRVRHIDAVWWDDSIAGSAETDAWRDRIAEFSSPGRHVRHAWITHHAWLDQRQSALEGGVDAIITKPFRIDSLLQTLGIASRKATGSLRQAA